MRIQEHALELLEVARVVLPQHQTGREVSVWVSLRDASWSTEVVSFVAGHEGSDARDGRTCVPWGMADEDERSHRRDINPHDE